VKNTDLCQGCYSDFYNGNNPMGIKECWHLKSAEEVVRFLIHKFTAPTVPGAFRKVVTYNCWQASDFSAYRRDEIPECATGVPE
jgi:hypothetical protein